MFPATLYDGYSFGVTIFTIFWGFKTMKYFTNPWYQKNTYKSHKKSQKSSGRKEYINKDGNGEYSQEGRRKLKIEKGEGKIKSRRKK